MFLKSRNVRAARRVDRRAAPQPRAGGYAPAGLGLGLASAVASRDQPTVEAITMLITGLYIAANLLAVAALTSPQLGARRLKPGDEIITVAAAEVSAGPHEAVLNTGSTHSGMFTVVLESEGRRLWSGNIVLGK